MSLLQNSRQQKVGVAPDPPTFEDNPVFPDMGGRGATRAAGVLQKALITWPLLLHRFVNFGL